MSNSPTEPGGLTPVGRILVLVVAFSGWFCSGGHMTITQLVGGAAAVDFLAQSGELDKQQYLELIQEEAAAKQEFSSAAKEQLENWKGLIARRFAWLQCAFLFGAASGGLLFGVLGDWIGRAKAMSLSILTYSVFAGVSSAAPSFSALLVLWFLACMGTGGMWPNGVALVSEVWTGLSRPLIAGVIGTAANIGIFAMATIASFRPITPDDWRWAMLVGASPVALGLFSFFFVPESPRWLALRNKEKKPTEPALPAQRAEIFRPPLLGVTLVGICLATVPIIGGWGSANWMIPWAGQAGQAADPPLDALPAMVAQTRSLTGIIGSLLGGWIACLVGRRRSYFLISLAAFTVSEAIFWFLTPTDSAFLVGVALLGFISGLYFGWLPLFLPEMFPTRVRAAGSGTSFNFGRILTACTLFATGALVRVFESDYAQIGRVTSLIFAIGMVVILFAPAAGENQFDD